MLIGREDPRILGPGLAQLLRLLNEKGVTTVVHPASLEELKKDRAPSRRELVLSKVRTYPVLESPPVPEEGFLNRFGAVSNHDKVDARLAYAVFQNAVSFLLTEDQGLILSACRVGLQDRVLSTEAALQYFLTYFGRAFPPLPAHLREVPVHALDLRDPIFDSLKLDYPGFEEWFRDVSRKGRRCVRVRLPEGGLAGVLIFKEEVGEKLLQLPPGRRLKLATFKVSNELPRQGVGELLLSFALSYCRKNRFEECYVTVFPHHPEVPGFLTPFGFMDIGGMPNNERVLLKRFLPDVLGSDLLPVDFFRRFYPNFRDDALVRKFLVPIQPSYHRSLFPDFDPVPGYQHTLDGTVSPTYAAGNAIRKAYLSNSATGKVRPGDVLLFYRSQDVQAVTRIGLVEETRVCQTPTEIIDFVGNRTVLSDDVLKEMCTRNVLAIHFWSVGELPDGSRGDLREAGLSPPMSIQEISNEEYRSLCGK